MNPQSYMQRVASDINQQTGFKALGGLAFLVFDAIYQTSSLYYLIFYLP